MDELSKNEAMGDLYALYGALLTQGQQDYFEDYYYNDLSLGEIADNRQVSRQAVYDNLRRSSKALEKYEAKLHLLASYNQLEEGISRALNSLLAEDQEAAKLQLEELLQVIRGE
ncbi:YlxM family DNA-binding protein [Lactobacillus nasalidis]|nr:transcriptional regulator [Lactobacillus nasalidis]